MCCKHLKNQCNDNKKTSVKKVECYVIATYSSLSDLAASFVNTKAKTE